MSAALTAPFVAAGLVLCVAGVAKLRAPGGASRALSAIRIPAGVRLVRTLGAIEVALGALCAVQPSLGSAGAAAFLYAIFAVVSLLLAGRRSSCGCFGDQEVPATLGHSALSMALAVVAILAAFSAPHGIAWMFARPPQVAVVLVTGTVAAAYGIVLAYTELPQAWSSWSKVRV
jgi:hypothetical protein